jgi:glycosyltransferase involved in cell wall biosynthesis
MRLILSVDPIKFPLTGIGRYTYELASGLQRAKLNNLQFLHHGKLQNTLPKIDDSKPIEHISNWRVYAQKSRLIVAAYQVLNPLIQARALNGLEDHIFHGPNFYLPPFGGRCVVTMHDLSLYLWPQSHPPERVRYMQAEIERSLKRATALITDTEYTRLEVAKFFGWPLDRIHAVPLASGPDFRPRTREELRNELSRFSLEPMEYALFTGTVEPRKNISILLDAYSKLPLATRTRWPLVITGYKGWRSEDLHARMDRAQREGWLRYLGFVPQHVLPILMAGARLFAFPSLYEGFGLPVLEAMASGVPVVCSNASTLPEVAGNAATFHSPEDVDTLSRLLQSGLEDDALREKSIKAGLVQAGKFSWERCTCETLNVYKTVMKNQ